jgi:transcriptional regulator with XRE-family HTH domain
MTLGTYLLHLRRQRNLSQKDVAAAINVAQSTYCEWESDARLPKTIYILPLARFFNLTEDEILQKINGQNLATETELYRLKTENDYLRQRDAKQEETIHTLQNTIKKLSQTIPPINGIMGDSGVGGGGGNALNFSSLKRDNFLKIPLF